MHLVHLYDRILGIQVGCDVATVFLDFEFEGVDDAVDVGVGILLLEAHGGVLAVEQRQLQHFLDLEAQALGLIVDDP